MKEKRMEVKMIGCELGGEVKCRRKEMGTGRKKKRDKLGQLKMKAETR